MLLHPRPNRLRPSRAQVNNAGTPARRTLSARENRPRNPGELGQSGKMSRFFAQVPFVTYGFF